MIPWWVLAVVVFGVNVTLWGLIGLLRLLDSSRGSLTARLPGPLGGRRRERGKALAAEARVGVGDVAVLIAAHNEQAVIADSLRAITELVPPESVHVVSDGSTDDTVAAARRCGVRVLSTRRNVGKAGALQEGIRRFGLVRRFRAVMLLDADTQVRPGYFDAALPLFDDPAIVAVAGCVTTSWRARGLSPVGKLVAFHRQRIYAVTQYVLKFGQTWRRANATHIVPGFASLYRTEVLPRIEVNPPGLVIEDFNMTFEVYQKRLGRVGFTPRAVAATQDPGTLRDYVRQCRRWSLGLWQTVRRHPPRANLFSAMLGLMLIELLSSSIMLVLLPLALLLVVVPEVAGLASLPPVAAWHAPMAAVVGPEALVFGLLVPDLVLTCLVALFQRQPRFLLFGCCFLPLRVLDSVVALWALVRAWMAGSTGRWRSPARSSITAAAVDPGSGAATRAEGVSPAGGGDTRP